MMQRSGVLGYKNFRYLKATGLLSVIAIGAYLIQDQSYGGTWLGYALGILSVLNIGLLMWYGIAKRRISGAQDRRQYQKNATRKQDGDADQAGLPGSSAERRKLQAKDSWRYGVTLQGWLSAHIYLGASLIVFASLHTAFHFGWNVHTLSFVLMMLVIASGFYGVYAYLNYPRMITLNMGSGSMEDLLLKIGELDELARTRALSLPDEVNALVLRACRETRLGGNFFQQLKGWQRDCPTSFAVQQVLLLGKKYTKDDQPKLLRDLYSVLLHKEKLVLRARNLIMLQARLQAWLYLHAPLSVALLAALAAHIVAIYFYW